MASKLAPYDTGYDDERFEHVVSASFHCVICTNVLKDPVACRHNEHLFCRACITEHLKNHHSCPMCMDPLTVDTLSQASRGVRNLLAELKIRCEFFDRGCGEFIELGNLESHIRECGFAPAVCSNEGCELEVNKQDLLHHETAVCEQRRVKCHSCNDIRQEIDIVKDHLAVMNEKLDRNMENLERKEIKSVKAVVSKVEQLQGKLNEQEESNRRLEADNLEIKKSLDKIAKVLEIMTQQTSHAVQAEQEQMKKGIAEAVDMDRETKVIIAGGENDTDDLNSVEMFSLSNGTWKPLQSMQERRSGSSSVVYNNQFIVIGGYVMSMEKLSLNAVDVDPSITWETVAAELPRELAGLCSVVYNDRLIVIGGYDTKKDARSDRITEISLVWPYTKKLLARMRNSKCDHGVVLFGHVLVIVGGKESLRGISALNTVVTYDITTSTFKELAPLPYPVHEMAIVKWGGDNVIIMGGADTNDEPLNTVLIYNINTQESFMLPSMKHRRKGCVAAVVRDTVIVMGGLDETDHSLKSVEGFRFDRYTWEELPEMHEVRCWATAALC